MVGRVADKAVQFHGEAGYMEEYAVAPFIKTFCCCIYEGTSQIQQTIIAGTLLRDYGTASAAGPKVILQLRAQLSSRASLIWSRKSFFAAKAACVNIVKTSAS